MERLHYASFLCSFGFPYGMSLCSFDGTWCHYQQSNLFIDELNVAYHDSSMFPTLFKLKVNGVEWFIFNNNSPQSWLFVLVHYFDDIFIISTVSTYLVFPNSLFISDQIILKYWVMLSLRSRSSYQKKDFYIQT